MHHHNGTLELSATDLSLFLGCRHRTSLDMSAALGLRAAPAWIDPVAQLLQERGLDHERRYAEELRAQGLSVSDISEQFGDDAVASSIAAMTSGVEVILQAALRDGRWFGRPDVLRRIEKPSGLGAWSYEVFDTKLAKETRGGTVLQLTLYSEMLGRLQGFVPEVF